MLVRCQIHSVNAIYLQNLELILAFKGLVYAKKTWHIWKLNKN